MKTLSKLKSGTKLNRTFRLQSSEKMARLSVSFRALISTGNNMKCECGSNKETEAVYDGYGIYLCRVCEDCRGEKLSKYRRDIFERYDCDEDIDDDY